MKYFLFLFILASCRSGPRKAVIAHSKSDTAGQTIVKPDATLVDLHDPYVAGKDTVRLNKVIEKIFNLPEVEAINKRIDKTSKGRHGASIMVQDEFNGDSSYYQFMVGDNSHEDRYVNIFDFLMDKKTGQIKAYDPVLDSIMRLQDWRNSRKSKDLRQ